MNDPLGLEKIALFLLYGHNDGTWMSGSGYFILNKSESEN